MSNRQQTARQQTARQQTARQRLGGWLLAGALLAGALLASAQTGARAVDSPDTVAPDRPGFTNGSDTVAPGYVQIEMGVARTKGGVASSQAVTAGEAQSTDAPQALVRLGLTAKTEMRVTLPDFIWPSGGASGFSDGAVGIRYKFYESKDGNTKLALTPTLSVPVRSAVTSSGHVDPFLTLSGEKDLGARWNVEANLSLSYPTQDGRRVTDYTGSGEVSYALSGPLAVYGDFYYDAPVGSPPNPIADGGFTYKAAKNVQIDLETGRGLGGGAPVQFYGGGVAIRF